MPYILEVQKININGKKEHVGYVNKVFKTKQDACDYYDMYNPHMRSLNANNNWCSDIDTNSGLLYTVIEGYKEIYI